MSALREDWGMTSRQIFLLTLALVGATEILAEPAVLALFAGQDAWMSALLGLPLGIFPLLAWYWLDRRLPGLTLSEQARAVAGPALGALLMVPFFVRAVTAVGTAERQVSELVLAITLPRTPPALVTVLLVLPVVLVVRMGPEVLARMSEILVSLGVGAVLLLSLVAANHASAIELLPILARGWRPVLQGAAVSAGFYYPTAWMLFVLPFRGCSRKAALGAALGGLASAAVLLALTTALSIMIFGGLTPLLDVPFLQVARVVQLSEFLTHLDPLFVTVWEALSFIKTGLFMYVLCLALAQTMGLPDYRPLTLPVATMTVIGSVSWFATSVQAAHYATEALPFISMLTCLVSPTTILVLALVRVRKKCKRGRPRARVRRAAA